MRDIRLLLRKALRAGLDADRVADFLAGVDWGQLPPAGREAALLGRMEGWTTAYSEGDLSESEYVARLLSGLARPEEQRRRLTMGAAVLRIIGPGLVVEEAGLLRSQIEPDALVQTVPA
jgi:hypothetical protein